MNPINPTQNEQSNNFIVQVFAGIKENFKNRVASAITIGITAIFSIAITYVGGALAFQYRAADEIFTIKAEVSDLKTETKQLREDFNDYLQSNSDTLKELLLKNTEMEKRVDRIDNKLDQLLLK